MSVKCIIGDKKFNHRKFDVAIAPEEPYIYFEHQVEFQCGLCVLNNMYGYHAFTLAMLNTVASSLTEAQGMITQEAQITEAAPVEAMSTAAGMFAIDVLMMAVNHVRCRTLGWVELRHIL